MRSNPSRRIWMLTLSVVCAGCAWVPMQPEALQVRVYPLGQSMASCKPLGEVATSVTAHVGPYDRNRLAVRDELETLARNEALTLHADAVQPLDEPSNGRQRWQAFRCSGGSH